MYAFGLLITIYYMTVVNLNLIDQLEGIFYGR